MESLRITRVSIRFSTALSFLGNRDLYGDLAKIAHADGLTVVARMDSNRASEDFFKAHPDWFTRDIDGKPYRAADKYITCVNSHFTTKSIFRRF